LQRISEGIQQIKVPMSHNPLGYTYVYLLEEDFTLIDTGTGSQEAIQGLRRELRTVNRDLNDIKRIIVTHLHGDHIGLVDYIRSISGAEVIAHRSAIEYQRLKADKDENAPADIRKETKLMGGEKFMSLLNNIARRVRGRPYILELDRPVDDGDTIILQDSELKVFWTPGHAASHICLHDARRKIFYAGDHALPKITPHISLHDPWDGDPLNDFMKSHDKIRGLDVKTVLPAHEYIYNDLEARIDAIQEHHLERCEEMKNAMRNGSITVFDISSEVHWDSRPWLQMSFWTKRMAAAETLAHLVYMRNKGEISEEVKDGVLHYSLA